MSTVVVYVHGLWMLGIEGALLRRRLAASLNAHTPGFSYRSVSAGISVNAKRLASRLQSLTADSVHLVGHSLGGLVILKMFEEGVGSRLPPGRVVMLGSPLGGSRAAQTLASWSLGRRILGRSIDDAVLTVGERRWAEPRELGVIAGSRNLGLGRMINNHSAPSDGTVFVDETVISGMKEHIVVPVNHTGLPFSANVGRLTAQFLQSGHFGSVTDHACGRASS